MRELNNGVESRRVHVVWETCLSLPAQETSDRGQDVAGKRQALRTNRAGGANWARWLRQQGKNAAGSRGRNTGYGLTRARDSVKMQLGNNWRGGGLGDQPPVKNGSTIS